MSNKNIIYSTENGLNVVKVFPSIALSAAVPEEFAGQIQEAEPSAGTAELLEVGDTYIIFRTNALRMGYSHLVMTWRGKYPDLTFSMINEEQTKWTVITNVKGHGLEPATKYTITVYAAYGDENYELAEFNFTTKTTAPSLMPSPGMIRFDFSGLKAAKYFAKIKYKNLHKESDNQAIEVSQPASYGKSLWLPGLSDGSFYEIETWFIDENGIESMCTKKNIANVTSEI